MDLDKRVQRLEDDVNILKNQIRNTLLDIQEQLAANYHPALRSQRSQRGGARKAEAPEFPEDEPDEPEERPRPPKVKRVSLDEIRQAPREDADSPSSRSSRSTDERHGNPGLYAELLQWAGATAEKIGPAHTRRVLETYASDGHLPAGLVENVVRLAALPSAATADHEPGLQDTLEALRTLNEVLAGDRVVEGRDG